MPVVAATITSTNHSSPPPSSEWIKTSLLGRRQLRLLKEDNNRVGIVLVEQSATARCYQLIVDVLQNLRFNTLSQKFETFVQRNSIYEQQTLTAEADQLIQDIVKNGILTAPHLAGQQGKNSCKQILNELVRKISTYIKVPEPKKAFRILGSSPRRSVESPSFPKEEPVVIAKQKQPEIDKTMLTVEPEQPKVTLTASTPAVSLFREVKGPQPTPQAKPPIAVPSFSPMLAEASPTPLAGKKWAFLGTTLALLTVAAATAIFVRYNQQPPGAPPKTGPKSTPPIPNPPAPVITEKHKVEHIPTPTPPSNPPPVVPYTPPSPKNSIFPGVTASPVAAFVNGTICTARPYNLSEHEECFQKESNGNGHFTPSSPTATKKRGSGIQPRDFITPSASIHVPNSTPEIELSPYSVNIDPLNRLYTQRQPAPPKLPEILPSADLMSYLIWTWSNVYYLGVAIVGAYKFIYHAPQTLEGIKEFTYGRVDILKLTSPLLNRCYYGQKVVKWLTPRSESARKELKEIQMTVKQLNDRIEELQRSGKGQPPVKLKKRRRSGDKSDQSKSSGFLSSSEVNTLPTSSTTSTSSSTSIPVATFSTPMPVTSSSTSSMNHSSSSVPSTVPEPASPELQPRVLDFDTPRPPSSSSNSTPDPITPSPLLVLSESSIPLSNPSSTISQTASILPMPFSPSLTSSSSSASLGSTPVKPSAPDASATSSSFVASQAPSTPLATTTLKPLPSDASLVSVISTGSVVSSSPPAPTKVDETPSTPDSSKQPIDDDDWVDARIDDFKDELVPGDKVIIDNKEVTITASPPSPPPSEPQPPSSSSSWWPW